MKNITGFEEIPEKQVENVGYLVKMFAELSTKKRREKQAFFVGLQSTCRQKFVQF
jgi:hypothetical protein